jgi:hypothetical protein
MTHPRIHEPPPTSIITELTRAGLSLSTAMAMEPWKAAEVLELLRSTRRVEARQEPTTPTRGSI